MRLIYLGSGEFGLPTLQYLHAHHDVVAVISQPDRPAGRKRQLTPTPIAAWAQQQGLNVLKSDDVNTPEFVEQVRRLDVDAAIVIAFGQKLSPQLIKAAGKLVVNLHASLLPKYRGAAPINWAMIQGEREAGVTVIGLAQTMDAGEMYARASLTIDPLETAGELHDRLSQLGPDTIGDVLAQFEAGTLQPTPQVHEKATRAPKLSKADGTVNFNQPAEMVRCRIHGLTPWPGCRVNWHCQQTGQDQVLFIRRVNALPEIPEIVTQRYGKQLPEPGTVLESNLVTTSDGLIQLLELQAAGTRVMKADAFARGHQLGEGDKLTPLAED